MTLKTETDLLVCQEKVMFTNILIPYLISDNWPYKHESSFANLIKTYYICTHNHNNYLIN